MGLSYCIIMSHPCSLIVWAMPIKSLLFLLFLLPFFLPAPWFLDLSYRNLWSAAHPWYLYPDLVCLPILLLYLLCKGPFLSHLVPSQVLGCKALLHMPSIFHLSQHIFGMLLSWFFMTHCKWVFEMVRIWFGVRSGQIQSPLLCVMWQLQIVLPWLGLGIFDLIKWI